MKPTEACKDCSCEYKTKYMIRVDHDHKKAKAKRHLEATTKRSLIGWLKHLVDEYKFETIIIYNPLTECEEHKEYWNKRLKK